MKNYFKTITDINHPKHIIYMLASILISVIVILSVINIINLRNDFKAIDTKYNELETSINTKLELLQELDTEQNIIIADLKLNLSDHEEDIQINFDDINRLQAELKNMKINNDRFSETAMVYCLDELWEYVEMLEKRVK